MSDAVKPYTPEELEQVHTGVAGSIWLGKLCLPHDDAVNRLIATARLALVPASLVPPPEAASADELNWAEERAVADLQEWLDETDMDAISPSEGARLNAVQLVLVALSGRTKRSGRADADLTQEAK